MEVVQRNEELESMNLQLAQEMETLTGHKSDGGSFMNKNGNPAANGSRDYGLNSMDSGNNSHDYGYTRGNSRS